MHLFFHIWGKHVVISLAACLFGSAVKREQIFGQFKLAHCILSLQKFFIGADHLVIF